MHSELLDYGKKTLLLLRGQHWRKPRGNILERTVIKSTGSAVLPQLFHQFRVIFPAVMLYSILHGSDRIGVHLPKHFFITGGFGGHLLRCLFFLRIIIISYAAFHIDFSSLPAIYMHAVRFETRRVQKARSLHIVS